MIITKSESRERFHAEQKTENGTILGAGNTRQEAVAECIRKVCYACGRTLDATSKAFYDERNKRTGTLGGLKRLADIGREGMAEMRRMRRNY